MSVERPPLSRLLQLVAGPPLIIGLLVFIILSEDYAKRSTSQQQQFGEATADQLSDLVVQYVMNEDLLSLNVITAKMSKKQQVVSVSVYDETGDLIAHSGRLEDGGKSFSAKISFQGAVIGHVRVAVPNATPAEYQLLLLPLMLLLALVFGAYLRLDSIVAWLYPQPLSEQETATQSKSTILEESRANPECFLLVRIRPAQYLSRHFHLFYKGAKRFNGIVEQTTPEELIMHFDSKDSMYDAVSTGILLQQMSKILQGKMSFGGSIGLVGEHTEKRIKAASYLASLAENELLIMGGEWLLRDRATLHNFHHSLVDSEDIRLVAEISDQDSLLQYALTLSKN